MENCEIRRLKMLLFNNSRIISHVHIFGEDGSGRSEIVRQLLRKPENDWVRVLQLQFQNN